MHELQKDILMHTIALESTKGNLHIMSWNKSISLLQPFFYPEPFLRLENG